MNSKHAITKMILWVTESGHLILLTVNLYSASTELLETVACILGFRLINDFPRNT